MSNPTQQNQYRLGLLFTGHMIDLPDRAQPRFPPASEADAAAAIEARIAELARESGGSLIGIASGARGGDILFHEACEKCGVPTILVLPFAPDQFRETSVSGVGTGHWDERFAALLNRLAPDRRIVLDEVGAGDPFGACNRYMLSLVKSLADGVKLMALWDGADAGKPGGTGAFVDEVRAQGGELLHLDTNALRTSGGTASPRSR